MGEPQRTHDAGYRWEDFEGDSGFLSAGVDAEESARGVVAVLGVTEGKSSRGVYVTRDQAGELIAALHRLVSDKEAR